MKQHPATSMSRSASRWVLIPVAVLLIAIGLHFIAGGTRSRASPAGQRCDAARFGGFEQAGARAPRTVIVRGHAGAAAEKR